MFNLFVLNEKIVESMIKDAASEGISPEDVRNFIMEVNKYGISDDPNNKDLIFMIFKNNVHKKFFDLLSPYYEGKRVILNGWFESFVDRKGDNIVYKFQKDFHQAFWEFYLFAVTKNLNLKIDSLHNRPDFVVTHPSNFYMEACTANFAQKDNVNMVDETKRTLNDSLSAERPLWKDVSFENLMSEAIIRYSNALAKKNEKEYQKLEWINKDYPFVYALGSYSQLNYGRESHYPILALLYGKYINDDGVSFSDKDYVEKSNGVKLPLNFFGNKKNIHVSAIVFSSKVTLGKVAAMAESLTNIEKKNPNYVFNIYQDMEKNKFRIAKITRSIPDFYITCNPIFFFDSERKDRLVESLKDNDSEDENLLDGLFVLHNPNADQPLDINLFSNERITQVFFRNGELEFKNAKNVLISRFDHLFYYYDNADPIGYQKKVLRNFMG